MEPAARFAELVGADRRHHAGADLPLDLGALLIAACVRPPVDIDASLRVIDDLAAQCHTATFEGVRAALFTAAGFAGNVASYDDPENSFLDAVLERRVGIPITLSIVFIAVARRLGVEVAPIGMPGHFLVQDVASAIYCDPFARGALLDVDDCRQRYQTMFGAEREFHPSVLEPTAPGAVLARVLANLERGPLARDSARLRVLLDLHATIVDLHPAHRLALASRYEALGAFDSAAVEAARAASQMSERDAPIARARANALRARTN